MEAPLFHLVDQLWDKKGYVFQWSLAHEEEAQVIIPGLIPIVQHEYGDKVVKSFTPNTVAWMKSETYDDQTGEISSPMDAYIKEVEEEDKELNLEREAIKEKDGKKNQ